MMYQYCIKKDFCGCAASCAAFCAACAASIAAARAAFLSGVQTLQTQADGDLQKADKDRAAHFDSVDMMMGFRRRGVNAEFGPKETFAGAVTLAQEIGWRGDEVDPAASLTRAVKIKCDITVYKEKFIQSGYI